MNDAALSLRWICSGCNQEMNQDEVNQTEEIAESIILKSMQRPPVDKNSIDFCEQIFLTIGKKLHLNHALLMKLRLYLIRLYGNVPGYRLRELSRDLLQRKNQLCHELLTILHRLCPGYSRLRGEQQHCYYIIHKILTLMTSCIFRNRSIWIVFISSSSGSKECWSWLHGIWSVH